MSFHHGNGTASPLSSKTLQSTSPASHEAHASAISTQKPRRPFGTRVAAQAASSTAAAIGTRYAESEKTSSVRSSPGASSSQPV